MDGNNVRDVVEYFREVLCDLYDKEEIENFVYYSFEKFLGFSKTDMVMKSQQEIDKPVLLKLEIVVEELKKQKPIQYILGDTQFYGLHFTVNEHVLIPRPETEELVDLIVKDVLKERSEYGDKKTTVLDIGTGSGCIAVSLKKHIPGTIVYALDISESALLVAKENARINDVELNFIQSDIHSFTLPDSHDKFDVIVSNPPYVLHSEKKIMNKNVLDFEPHLALFVSDDDPLLFYRSILFFAENNLNRKGKLYFEINELLGEKIKLMAEERGFLDVVIKKDLNNKNRILRCLAN